VTSERSAALAIERDHWRNHRSITIQSSERIHYLSRRPAGRRQTAALTGENLLLFTHSRLSTASRVTLVGAAEPIIGGDSEALSAGLS
jgi:hypothetical protein